MKAPKHAPTPWNLYGKAFVAANGYNVAVIFTGEKNDPECNAHRAFLLAAVNNHEAISETLQDVLAAIDKDRDFALPRSLAKRARAALKGVIVDHQDPVKVALENLIALVRNQDVTITRPGVNIENYLAAGVAALKGQP